jgi:arylsulfatase A-like enzyme
MTQTKKGLRSLAGDLLPLAAGFGLISGIVEGLLLLFLRHADWLNWRLYNRAFWYETLWIAPLVDLILFLLVGFVLTLVGLVLKKAPVKRIAWFLFLFMIALDWGMVILFGRISLIPLLILVIGVSFQLMNLATRPGARFEGLLLRATPWLAGAALAILLIVQGGGWLKEQITTANLPKPKAETPNIIVLVVDTLRADHLSAYGYERDTSPFIDSLAQEGVQFQNAISPASWTQPSHASMLTGRYTYEHQAELKPLDNRYETIGEAMQTQGYRTGAFSGNTEFFTRRQGFGRGFLHFEDNDLTVTDGFLNSSVYGFVFDFYGLRKALNYEGVPARRYAADINRSVLNWVDKEPDKPFFVFMNYFDVHDPYLPPQPYRSKYSSIPIPGGLINGFVDRYHPDLTPEQLQSEIDAYDGAISYVDDQIKDLFAELDKRGLLQNTVVIVTADHGESLGEHNLLQHSASLYLQEIHVPLVIWGWPSAPSGKLIDTPVSLTALPTTIFSLVNPGEALFPGPSLSVLIDSDSAPADWPEPISEVAQFSGAAEQNPTTHGAMKSVVGLNLQYIVHEKFGEELYNWREDPQERNNLIDESSSQSIVETFKAYLQKLIGKIFE